MNPGQVFVADLVALLLGATLVGALVTGRVWLCRSFGLYLLTTLGTNRLVTWWPDQFFTWRFCVAKELLQPLLIAAVAIEIAIVGLSAFPRARRIALSGVLAVVLATAVCVALGAGDDPGALVGSVVGHAALGAAWSMLVVVAVAYWYRLPLGPWHRMLALGFLLHNGLYAVLLGAVGHFGWQEAARYLVALDPAAFAATVGLWAFASWRMEWLQARVQRPLRGGSEP